jgi:hypothetical protein
VGCGVEPPFAGPHPQRDPLGNATSLPKVPQLTDIDLTAIDK